MAAITVVSCPECEKKFKPKGDVQGKKIKCPFCTHPFVVPAAQDAKSQKPAKETAVKASKAKVEAAPLVAAAPEEKPRSEFDRDEDPYGVKSQDLTNRCPHCAKEMAGANAVICIHCGYNTLTRERGRTEKVFGLTASQHIVYLLPAIGAAAFVCVSIILLLVYCTVGPFLVADTMMEFTDHESMRMWTTLIFLSWIYGGATFCFKKFIEHPKPEEIKKD